VEQNAAGLNSHCGSRHGFDDFFELLKEKIPTEARAFLIPVLAAGGGVERPPNRAEDEEINMGIRACR
jgi:hypothetical protein